jgi:hypothetical protein
VAACALRVMPSIHSLVISRCLYHDTSVGHGAEAAFWSAISSSESLAVFEALSPVWVTPRTVDVPWRDWRRVARGWMGRLDVSARSSPENIALCRARNVAVSRSHPVLALALAPRACGNPLGFFYSKATCDACLLALAGRVEN